MNSLENHSRILYQTYRAGAWTAGTEYIFFELVWINIFTFRIIKNIRGRGGYFFGVCRGQISDGGYFSEILKTSPLKSEKLHLFGVYTPYTVRKGFFLGATPIRGVFFGELNKI